VHPECRKQREKEGKGAFSLPFPSVAGSDNSCKAKKKKIFHEIKRKKEQETKTTKIAGAKF
jgi:hypothetical protein